MVKITEGNCEAEFVAAAGGAAESVQVKDLAVLERPKTEDPLYHR